ncbi:MAG TPA: AAA family ATPase [Acidobacteriota bacterium]|nr:AAA family ATPase [Acidobacteriota bacterium]
MYCEHFRLSESPFSLGPDPRYFFMSEQHREGLGHLLYGIQQPDGFVQLTGEIGCGKTTLCRCLVKQLPEGTEIALILNPRLTVLELLASVCDELRVPYPAQATSIKVLVDALNQHLLEAHAQRRRTVLVIDEAQNLHSDVLEQIRLLTNLETTREKLLQIILIGQPELLALLEGKKLRQLAQRITARYHLQALSRRETYAYIRHRLSVAGRRDPLFTAPALRSVYRLSRGVPRLINIICDRALLGAYTLDKRMVGASIVRRASREIRGIGLWYRRLWPAWAAGVATLAVLIAGSAMFLTTANRSFHRRNAPDPGTIGRAAGGPATRSQTSTPPPAEKSGGGVAGGTTSSIGVEDPQVRDGIGLKSPQEVPKADPANYHPTGGSTAGAVSKSVRLADIIADPQLRGISASSFSTLYARLGIKVPPGRTALWCNAGIEQGYECIFLVGNWTRLRYFDLPAILQLTSASGLRLRVALVALGDDAATLAIGGREYTFPLAEIDKVWDGSFILVWKLPFPLTRISLGSHGAEVAWVRQSLDALEGKAPGPGVSDQYDESLQRRVTAFQRDRALPPDGVIGGATLVRLTLALRGPNAPSLLRRSP